MKAKKHLGQHFLNSKKAIETIIKAGDLTENEFVLEIGPGKGVLTESLLKLGVYVLAIEKDLEMIEILKEKFEKEIKTKRLILINDDILEINLDKYLKNKKYKLIANIPYYITGEIFKKFLEHKHKPVKLVLLVQKEVAERIVCRDNKESILSLSVKFFGKPKYIETVKAGSFSPPPKVDSAILEIKDLIERNKKETEKFFDIVKLSFAHKRKKLFSNLSLKYNKESIENCFQVLKIDKNVRAEDLDINNYLYFAENCLKNLI